mgnify:CR=1 FL=1
MVGEEPVRVIKDAEVIRVFTFASSVVSSPSPFSAHSHVHPEPRMGSNAMDGESTQVREASRGRNSTAKVKSSASS